MLPEREVRTFWIDGDRLHEDPVDDAELIVDGGFLVPGLVDVHTHPGSESPGDPFDDEALRRHLITHRDAGVLTLRAPGSAARIPGWAENDRDLPRIQSAGPWLATPGRFFPGYGRDVTDEELVAAAVEESKASSSGWCKVIGDWIGEESAVSLDLLRSVAEAVHGVGGRLAVHCTTATGARNAVLAGVDSLEHGTCLDPALLGQMAEQGTALIPTMVAVLDEIDKMRAAGEGETAEMLQHAFDGLLSTVRAAHEAGVSVLAGTDCLPFGNVADEIGWLIRAGLSAEAAIGAGSWTARSWLGMAGLTDGAPADIVAYPTDPTVDPAALSHPGRIILRGRIVR